MLSRNWRIFIVTAISSLLLPGYLMAQEAMPQDAGYAMVEAERLQNAIESELMRVEEFRAISEFAESQGFRVWLFGGSATTFANHLKLVLLAEAGKTSRPKSELDFTLGKIFRWAQDIDLVTDGGEDAPGKLEQFIVQNFRLNHGGKTTWEVRPLREERRHKEPILAANFLDRHTDSLSIGFIEITNPPKDEPRMRDLAAWTDSSPKFIEDVANGRIEFYPSSNHKSSTKYLLGHNPEIISTIRFLIKVVQNRVSFSESDLILHREFVENFQSKTLTKAYPLKWIARNAEKIFAEASDLEFAQRLLVASGIAAKLPELRKQIKQVTDFKDADQAPRLKAQFDSLLALMARQPLPRRLDAVAMPEALQGSRPEAKTLYYVSGSYLEYELAARAPQDVINLFADEKINANTYGVVMRTEPSDKFGFVAEYELSANAVEGLDYLVTNEGGVEKVFVMTQQALQRKPGGESFRIDPITYFALLIDNKTSRRYDFRMLERMRESIEPQMKNLSAEDLSTIRAMVKGEVESLEPDEACLRDYFALKQSSKDGKWIHDLIGRNNLKIDALVLRSILIHEHWAESKGGQGAFVQIVTRAVDPIHSTNASRVTVLKDIFKLRTLKKYPGAEQGIRNIVRGADSETRTLIAERFFERQSPEAWPALFTEFTQGKSPGNMLPPKPPYQRKDQKKALDQPKSDMPRPSVFDKISGDDNFEPMEQAISSNRTDEITYDLEDGKFQEIFGRKEEANAVLDTLIRHKGKNPVLVGEAGVGKTSIIDLITLMLIQGTLPEALRYNEELRDAIVVQTSPAAISKLARANTPNAQALAVETFIKSLKWAEKKLGRRIVVFVDEMHTFEEPQLEALKTTLDSRDGILFVGSSTHNELLLKVSRNPALVRRLHTINVREFTPDETKQLLKETTVPMLQEKYSSRDGTPGTITDDALDAVIRRAMEYLPNTCRPDGPFKLLQDVVIKAHRDAGEQSPVIDEAAVGKFLVERLQLPLDPTNLQTFAADLEKLRGELKEQVIEGGLYTDAMVDLWQEIFFSGEGRSNRVLLVAGPTGSGKSHGARVFAKLALGSEERMLEIDGTKYMTGGHSLNSLIGAPPGIISSDAYKGLLPEFLNGRGRGLNVIVVNELDKAHPDFMKIIMEMIDTGKLQGGDGRTYRLGRSLILFTTNKGDEHVYPRDTKTALTRAEIEKRLSKITSKEIKQWFMQPDSGDMYNKENNLPPSTLERIDRAVAQAPPSVEGAVQVARNKAQQVVDEISDNQKVTIEVSDEVLQQIVNAIYVPEDGVRSVEREVKSVIYNSIVAANKHHQIKSGGRLRIDLEEKANAKDSFVVSSVEEAASSEVARLEAPDPRGRVANPLADEEIRQRASGMEDRLGSRVFGQEEAVKVTARAIRVRAINAQNNRPASLVFLGPTGIGKTELAKTVAKEVYGDENRMTSFDMGSVKWEGDFNNIFSPPKGFVGSSEVAPFERFLMNFPEGGVLLFDEVGNMGGGNKKVKTDLLYRFYSMLDEGTFRSVHGKVYNLRNFTIVFTSNEGQELFYDAPSDDLRLSAWEEARKKEVVTKLLRKSGWPEPLIGRLGGNIILFKPLLADERLEVSKKLVGDTLVELKSQFGLSDIEVDEAFFENVAETFYSHALGGRSIRSFVEGALTDAIGTALLENYDDIESMRSAIFSLKLSDSYAGLISFEGKVPPKRVVKLEIQVAAQDGTEIYRSSMSLGEDVPERRLQSQAQSKQTAIHEAGHAIVNDPTLTHQVVDFVTVKGQGNYGGYARYKPLGTAFSMSREMVIARIGQMLAGREAEKKSGYLPDSGWMSDLEKARELAEKAVSEYGLTDSALELPVAGGKVNIKNAKAQAEISKLLAEGQKYALDLINQHWAVLLNLADHLVERGDLDRTALDKILPLQEPFVKGAEDGADVSLKDSQDTGGSSRCSRLFLPQ